MDMKFTDKVKFIYYLTKAIKTISAAENIQKESKNDADVYAAIVKIQSVVDSVDKLMSLPLDNDNLKTALNALKQTMQSSMTYSGLGLKLVDKSAAIAIMDRSYNNKISLLALQNDDSALVTILSFPGLLGAYNDGLMATRLKLHQLIDASKSAHVNLLNPNASAGAGVNAEGFITAVNVLESEIQDRYKEFKNKTNEMAKMKKKSGKSPSNPTYEIYGLGEMSIFYYLKGDLEKSREYITQMLNIDRDRALNEIGYSNHNIRNTLPEGFLAMATKLCIGDAVDKLSNPPKIR